MKRISGVLFIFVIMLVMGCGVPGTNDKDVSDPGDILSVRGDAVYCLYSEPDPGFMGESSGYLQGGEQLKVINKEGNWVQVAKGETTGWIPSWYLKSGDKTIVKEIEPRYMVVKQDDNLYLYPDGETVTKYEGYEQRILNKGRLVKLLQEYGDWCYVELFVFSLPDVHNAWVKADILTEPGEITPVEGFLEYGAIILPEEEGHKAYVLDAPMKVFLTGNEKTGLVKVGADGGWQGWTAKENIVFTEPEVDAIYPFFKDDNKPRFLCEYLDRKMLDNTSFALSPELETVYEEFAESGSDALLQGLEPVDVLKLYFYAKHSGDDNTSWNLINWGDTDPEWINEIKQEWFEEEPEVVKQNMKEYYNKLVKKVKSVEQILYTEAEAYVFIVFEACEEEADFIQYRMEKVAEDTWKVGYMACQ